MAGSCKHQEKYRDARAGVGQRDPGRRDTRMVGSLKLQFAARKQERGMPFESSAKQDRADRKLAKYISRRSLTIGIAVLAVVIVTAVLYGSYGG